MSLRLFFAIDLPPSVRQAVDSWRTSRRFPGRPEATANLHITLVFLGSYPADRQSLDALYEVAARAPLRPFDIALDRASRWRNGILHLAPSSIPPDLVELHKSLNDGCADLGVKVDRRRFSPHVTLARECPPWRLKRPPSFAWRADRLTLFSSERGESGVVYRPIREWDLVERELEKEGEAEQKVETEQAQPTLQTVSVEAGSSRDVA